MHQPYRAQLFPALARSAGGGAGGGAYGACLSGGGSTVLALAPAGPASAAVAAAFERAAGAAGLTGRAPCWMWTRRERRCLNKRPPRRLAAEDGDRLTFVWHGPEPVHLLGDFNNWAMDAPPLALEPTGPEQWARTLQLPRDAYIDYAYIRDGVRFPDSRNPHAVSDGMGYVNSTFWMPDAQDTPLARRQQDVPRGTVTRHTVLGQGYVVGQAGRSISTSRPSRTHARCWSSLMAGATRARRRSPRLWTT